MAQNAEWVKIVKHNFHRQPMNLRLIEIRTKKEKFNNFNFRGWNKKWRQSKKRFWRKTKKTFLHLFSTFCLFSVTEAGLGWGIFGAVTTCQKSSHRAAMCRMNQIFNNFVSYSLKLCTIFCLHCLVRTYFLYRNDTSCYFSWQAPFILTTRQ